MSIKRLICAIGAALILTSCGTQLNSSFLMSGGQKLAQAATLTDEQMAAYVAQTVTQLDKENETLRTIRSMILADAAVLKLSTGNVDEALAEELDHIDSTLEHLRSCIRREVSTLHNSIK